MASLNFSYSLQNNQVADATQVMANFTNVKTFVESSSVQVDGSVQAGTAAIANGAITDSKLSPSLSLPRGRVAHEISSANSSAINSGAINRFTGVTFTPVVGRAYMISTSIFTQINYVDFTTESVNVAIVGGSNNLIQYLVPPPAGFFTSIQSYTDSFLFIPTTNAPVAFNVRLTIASGNPWCLFIGGAGYQNYILVEDIGLA